MKRDISLAPETFQTFGDLLTYLRKQARLTQDELGRAVGYSRTHITRLEKNQRLPDLASVAALFIPAFDLSPRRRGRRACCNSRPQPGHTAPSPSRAPCGARSSPPKRSRPSPRSQIDRAFARRDDSAAGARARRLDQLTPLLIDPAMRLLTLLGPPGVGKTRLALQLAWNAAAHFTDGAYWIDLSPITESGGRARR